MYNVVPRKAGSINDSDSDLDDEDKIIISEIVGKPVRK